MGVSDIMAELAQRFKVNAASGVIVISIEPASLAEEAGIRPGDIIYEINRSPVRDLKDYSTAVSKASGDALIGTYRGYVVLKEK
jgi:serine protease Do